MTKDPEKPVPLPADRSALRATPEASAPRGSDPEAPRSRARTVPPEGLPPLDERRLRFAELRNHRDLLDPDLLIDMVSDGRATVRGNAALGFAAAEIASPHLVSLLRDSDARVAMAAAEAIARLGKKIADLIPHIAEALDSTQAKVTDWVLSALADLIGQADPKLIQALDVNHDLADKTVIAACERAGRSGVRLLIRAAADERSRIRINAAIGLGRIGHIDVEPAVALLGRLEEDDPVPDVRDAARRARRQLIAPASDQVSDDIPKDIPDFEERRLAVSELAEYADAIAIDAMVAALQDGRKHVRINAARGLGIKGREAARAARSLALLLRDSVAQVRREAARALGKMGEGVILAASELVAALGDSQDDVAGAAGQSLASQGEAVLDALVRGLEIGDEAHGRRVVELIVALPRAPEILRTAFASPAENVQVNAALGLGMLGPERVGQGRDALLGARTGGYVRTREAVRRALEMLDSSADSGPAPVEVAGFEIQFLGPEDFAGSAGSLDAGDLIAYLQDGRDVVRANAACALGVLGPEAAAAARPLGVLLRDDAVRVRLAAAAALDKLGDRVVMDEADALVGTLGDANAGVADACAAVLAARKARVLGALLRGLETDNETHGRRILAIINLLPDAAEILCEAFESPAVNVQVNAALGLGMLGPERVAEGRVALEGARTGGHARTREAVFRALEMLDGPGASGPAHIDVDGFESRFLGPEAFAGAVSSMDAGDLVAYLQDGRDVVRANAACALGVMADAAAHVARPLGVLLRDDAAVVRLAAARALDKLGDRAVIEAADDLVGALGDANAEVADACAAVLAPRKTRILGALLRGLETDNETHGRRILAIINQLPDAAEILCDAFESPAVNVQVNAALGLGMLGSERVAEGRGALEGARTGGHARTREAVFRALEMLDGPGASGPAHIEVDGFESRFLGPEAFTAIASSLAADDLIAYLQDGRDVVRGNAACALGVMGEQAAGAARALAVLLRDDSARVRMAAARAMDELGDSAVVAQADFLVGALGDADADVAAASAAVLRARGARVMSALLRGLETDNEVHAERILRLIVALPDADEVLCDAFESPAVNVQVNAAIGLGMLGPRRVGEGRRVLEGARTGGHARAREAVFKALAMLDSGR